MEHRYHGSAMDSRGLVWVVTSSPGHSCWSLLPMVPGGTRSALMERAVPSLMTNGDTWVSHLDTVYNLNRQ